MRRGGNQKEWIVGANRVLPNIVNLPKNAISIEIEKLSLID